MGLDGNILGLEVGVWFACIVLLGASARGLDCAVSRSLVFFKGSVGMAGRRETAIEFVSRTPTDGGCAAAATGFANSKSIEHNKKPAKSKMQMSPTFAT